MSKKSYFILIRSGFFMYHHDYIQHFLVIDFSKDLTHYFLRYIN